MVAVNPNARGEGLVSQLVVQQIEITPHDVDELVTVTVGLAVNVSGLVKIMPWGGTVAVTRYMAAGVDYPWRVSRVYLTGTDAAVVTGKIFALYGFIKA